MSPSPAHVPRSMEPAPLWNLLVLTDEERFLQGLRESLPSETVRLDRVFTPAEAIARLRDEVFQVLVISTARLGAKERDFLQEAMGLVEELQVFLFVDQWAQVAQVSEVLRPLTWTILVRPQPSDHVAILIRSSLDRIRLQREVHYLRHREPYIYGFERVVGSSPQIQGVLRMVRRVAASDATILIQGESGTGKELIAAAIHFNSPRRNGPFVAVNCANLQETLLESELFGHEKGSFTGADRQRVGRLEQANGGTLFLDEVGDMSPRVQAKMLRVLQERAFERLGGSKTIWVNVRVLAATNQDLHKAMREKRFRDDLYFRLSVVPVNLPPLRDRQEDIQPLAEFFLRKYGGREGGSTGFRRETLECLRAYGWPGNVRELENVVERAVIISQGRAIAPADLMLPSGQDTGQISPSIQLPPGGANLEEVERDLILQALVRSHGVQKKAARLLGISPRAIHYKIRKHKIRLPLSHPLEKASS